MLPTICTFMYIGIYLNITYCLLVNYTKIPDFSDVIFIFVLRIFLFLELKDRKWQLRASLWESLPDSRSIPWQIQQELGRNRLRVLKLSLWKTYGKDRFETEESLQRGAAQNISLGHSFWFEKYSLVRVRTGSFQSIVTLENIWQGWV